MHRPFSIALLIFASVFFATAPNVMAQTTEFTYQGSLKDNANPANGTYDFEFQLYDAISGGTQIGSTLARSTVNVTNGIFSTKLDFGSQFPGASRYLEIHVRVSGQPSFTTLTPRQLVNSSPYSIKSINADTATNATNATTAQTAVNATNAINAQTAVTATNASNATTATTANNALSLGGVPAGQYVLTGDARLSDARSPTDGSASYIQNTTLPQTNSNFNISGNGTAGGTLSRNVVSAATFNISGSPVLRTPNSDTFLGGGAGQQNTFGDRDK